MTLDAVTKFAWVMLAACLLVLAPGRAAADTGEGKTIADFRVLGLKNFTEQEVLSQIRMKRGEKYSLAAASKDAEALLKTGWFLSNIRIAAEPRKDDAVTVLITVHELTGVVQEVVYKGAEHLSDSELSKLTGLRKGMPMNPVANQSAASAIRRKYHEDGRRYANVRLVEGGKASDARVFFDISEGPKVKINSIELKYISPEGWRHLQGPTCGRNSPPRPRGSASSAAASTRSRSSSTSTASAPITNNWASSASASRSRRKVSNNGSEVDLIFWIDEGPRYQVADVRMAGNKVFSDETLFRLTDTRPNTPYSKATIEGDVGRLKTYYGYSGRQVPIEEKLTEVSPGVVSVSYQVVETDPKRVGDVKIQSATTTPATRSSAAN